jgi:glycerol-3-phosphate acyltransferase PlsX
MIAGRIKGVKRAALAVLMPGLDGFYMLLDGGANIECRPEILQQFAIMGSIFMNKVMNVENPRVGLLNVGTEKEKGREIELETFRLLSNTPVNFIGNIEGRDPTLNRCDVAVTDGFTGNVYLKSIEGMGKFIKESMKRIFKANAASMAAYLLVGKNIKRFAGKMDYKEVGGSPLLGAAKPIIKAHGSSDARAFKNAVRQAIYFTERGVINEISEALAGLTVGK